MSMDGIRPTGNQGPGGVGNIQSNPTKQGKSIHARATQENASGVGVKLSKDALDLQAAHQKAYEIAMATPEVREEKIAELKEKIRSGTYKVDAGKVADGMLREAIKDKLATEFGE